MIEKLEKKTLKQKLRADTIWASHGALRSSHTEITGFQLGLLINQFGIDKAWVDKGKTAVRLKGKNNWYEEVV